MPRRPNHDFHNELADEFNFSNNSGNDECNGEFNDPLPEEMNSNDEEIALQNAVPTAPGSATPPPIHEDRHWGEVSSSKNS